MKGIELPINILVIIAVAVIVLLGVIALYFSGFMGPATIVNQDAAKTAGCKLIMSKVGGCQTVNSTYTDNLIYDGTHFGLPKFDADGNGVLGETTDTFTALCAHYFSASIESDCRAICGCTG